MLNAIPDPTDAFTPNTLLIGLDQNSFSASIFLPHAVLGSLKKNVKW